MKFRKIVSTFLTATMLTGYAITMPVSDNALAISAAAAESVFADDIFREYIFDIADKDKDGELSSDEINAVTDINVSKMGITDLKGIEIFTGLTYLHCDDNQLTTLDISKNTALNGLYCWDNQLTTLDVSNNTALKYLFCADNQITTLDVSKNTALTQLDCSNNRITALDVSKNTGLTWLGCINNQFTTLDVSNNTALNGLSCEGNHLTTLDVSKNTALDYLGCENNELTTLDISKNTALVRFFCYNNQLTTLDVSNNTALAWLYCQNNKLTTLDVSNNAALEILDCTGNQLTTLDLRNNIFLTSLYTDPDITIHVAKGSYAETYAKENNIPFVAEEGLDAVPYVYEYDNTPILVNVANNSATESGISTEGSLDITPSWVVKGHTTVAEFRKKCSAIDASSIVLSTCSKKGIDLSDFIVRIFIQTGSSTYEWNGWFEKYKNVVELSEFEGLNNGHVIQNIGFMIHMKEEDRVKYDLKVGDMMYINPDENSKEFYKIDISSGTGFRLDKNTAGGYSASISAVYNYKHTFNTLGDFLLNWSGMKIVGTDGISLTVDEIDINSLMSEFTVVLEDKEENYYYMYEWGKSIQLDNKKVTDANGDVLSDKAAKALKIVDVTIRLTFPAYTELPYENISMFTEAMPAGYYGNTLYWGLVPGAESYIIEIADKELTFKAPIEGFTPEDFFISEGMESGKYSINLYSVTDGKKSKIETFTYTYTAEPAVTGTITVSGDTEAIAGTKMGIKNSDGTDCGAEIEIASDGKFTVTGTLPDGDYTITASKSKCCPRDYTVTIEDGQMTGELNVELQLYGDVDNNGIVTLDDVIDVINYFNKKTSAISSADKGTQDYLIAVSDVDGDGVIKLDDAIEMINYFNKKASAFDKIV